MYRAAFCEEYKVWQMQNNTQDILFCVLKEMFFKGILISCIVLYYFFSVSMYFLLVNVQ